MTGRSLGWLVIGQGRAGRARVRDISAAPDHRLVAALSARELDAPKGDDAPPAELLDPAVAAVVVATANDSHGAWVRAGLNAGKHVLVEFPLCASKAEAEALFALAADHGRVLHVELIGLLTSPHRRFADRLVAPLGELESVFEGGLERWLQVEMQAGHLGQLAIGRLHALWQLAGPLRLVDATAAVEGGGYRLQATMRGQDGATVRLLETRSPGGRRAARLIATFPDGERVEREPFEPGQPLFAQDLAACARRIRTDNAAGGYVSDQDVIDVVALAEAISAACRS